MVETQSAFPWIDLDDNTGGPIVRAVMSNVSPAVWSSVFQQSAYKAVATYDMAQRRIGVHAHPAASVSVLVSVCQRMESGAKRKDTTQNLLTPDPCGPNHAGAGACAPV